MKIIKGNELKTGTDEKQKDDQPASTNVERGKDQDQEKEKNEKIFIVGGGEIYKQALNDANEMILSYMKFDAEGDVRFPDFDKNLWEIVSVENREKFDIYCYKKKNNG